MTLPLCCTSLLGVVPYESGWGLQKQLMAQRQQELIPDTLLLLQHPPTYTYGRGSDGRLHLLASHDELEKFGAEIREVDRGGDITFHGPGQIIGYPIIDLSRWHADAHRYVWTLEEVLIRTLADIGILATRNQPYTGVWAGDAKIASIGIKLKRWVTSHGFALNVNTDLSYFHRIIPCGLPNCRMTSIADLLNAPIDESVVTEAVIRHFGELFGRWMVLTYKKNSLSA
jgi:lipoyl(octanoyl) transferase